MACAGVYRRRASDRASRQLRSRCARSGALTRIEPPNEQLIRPAYPTVYWKPGEHTLVAFQAQAENLRNIFVWDVARAWLVEVLGNVVSVLTSRAIPAEEVDPAVAAEQLATVRQRRARGPDEMAARDRAIAQLRGQLRVAR